jgi:putative hemolysin
MINIEQAMIRKFPGFATQPKMIRKPAVSFLKKVIYQDEVNAFLEKNRALKSFEFIDAVFDYFNFSYAVSARDRANIPAEGRLVIIANHPIGSLDGLALLKLIGEVRSDVKIIANDLLMNFSNLHGLFIPVDNMGAGSALRSYRATLAALEREEAVVVFPAGEVSRASPTGVKDSRWRPGFLHFVRKTSAPLLPVHIAAKNSLLFYGASMLFKPLGTALLAHEMFNKRSHTIRFSVGEAISAKQLHTEQLHDRTLVKRLKKHVYQIGRKRRPIFETLRTIAHPEDRQQLQEELYKAQLLGETRDQNRIYLFDAFPDSVVMREIGRLREIAFRKVGEGTGSKRDLDDFDQHYRHLVLWDREKLEIAGAYRLGEGKRILAENGEAGFYTRTLYTFKPELHPYLEQGVELGRSFVNPDYWGKASLDYLWQGIGAYLSHHPEVRYLFGPVSMSADYPRDLTDALVYFYQRYHACDQELATAHHPYHLSLERVHQMHEQFGDREREQAFDLLQEMFAAQNQKFPVLFKQYAAVYEEAGFQSLVFSVDPDFGDCLDGMCMGDLSKLKPSKRKRYIG